MHPDLVFEKRVEFAEHAGNGAAPVLVMRASIEKVDLLHAEAAFGPRSFGYPHQRLRLPQWSKKRIDSLLVRSIEQREQALQITALGGKQSAPIAKLLEEKRR